MLVKSITSIYHFITKIWNHDCIPESIHRLPEDKSYIDIGKNLRN